MPSAVVTPALTWRAKVLKVSDECQGVKTIRLETALDFSFIPGMFVMVHLEDDPKATRAYSIASSPFEKGAIEISLNKVGPLSSRLFDLKEGGSLMVKGPYGKWHYQDDIPRAVLISGGTGITPLRSICRYVLEKKLPNKLTLLYSAKTPQAILYTEELKAFTRAGIKVFITVTRPEGTDWKGPTGRLGIDAVVREVPDFFLSDYFLCGPISLVENFTAALKDKGIPKERIHCEKWGNF